MLLHRMMAGFILAWAVALVACWLGWQLLRQNGRMLLRLEALEQRLDEFQLGELDEPAGLPLDSLAPDFELPDLAGEPRTLAQFRREPLLLIFFNPGCGFCRDMMPKLTSFLSEGRALRVPDSLRVQENQGLVELGPPIAERPFVLILTTGDAEKNRQFFAEHRIGCPVLLQNDGEVATAYQASGTPSGYLVSAEGKMASALAIGADALLVLAAKSRSRRREEAHSFDSQPSKRNSQPDHQSLVTSVATSRFGNRSLARSKIKRDGLKAGAPAPDFRLPRLDGRGELSLSGLRGKRLLLVFSDPHCGPCNALASELQTFHREQTEREAGRVTPCAPQRDGMPQNGAHGVARPTLASPPIGVVMISKGEPRENRAKVKKYGLTFPVVLQEQWEISRRYAMFATPIAYLISEQGVIAADVAVGVEPILALLNNATVQTRQWEPAIG